MNQISDRGVGSNIGRVGIHINGTDGLVEDNVVRKMDLAGILCSGCFDIDIQLNILGGNERGVYIDSFTQLSRVDTNIVDESKYGFFVSDSINNVYRNNFTSNNDNDLCIGGADSDNTFVLNTFDKSDAVTCPK